MKQLLYKIIFFTAVTTLIVLSGYFIYQSYLAYQSYKIAQNGDQYIAMIQNKNEALKNIELESTLSALYLADGGKTDFSKIQTARNKTDNALQNIKQFKLNNPKFLSDLQYARSRVDVISSDYKDILLSYYQDEISNTLLKEIQNNLQTLALGVDDIKTKIVTYNTFINYRNRISRENSFIAYIITRAQKMDTQDLLLWDNLLAHNQVDSEFKNLAKLNFQTRVGVVRGITTGNYEITTKEWLANNDQKITAIVQSENNMYEDILSYISNETLYPKIMMHNIAITLLLIFALLFLVHLQKNSITSNRSKRIKNKTHSDYTNENLSLPKETPADNSIETPSKPILDASAYNPLEKCDSFTQEFIEEASEKKLEVDYYIDPTIPTYAIGDFNKIEQALDNLIHYIINTSRKKDIIQFRIDNIAQNAMESAIRFAIRGHRKSFTKEETRIIYDYQYSHFQQEKVNSKLGGIKSNLEQVNKIISSINGEFKIEKNPTKGTDFFIIVNLKKQ